MKEIFKDYAAIIGPTIAFLLGMLTIFIKQGIDNKIESEKNRKIFLRFFEDINSFKFPSRYFPEKGSGIAIHADQARNITNLSRYYSQIIMYRSWMKSIESDLYNYGTYREIKVFNQILWFSEFQVKRIEEIRNKEEDLDEQEFFSLSQSHKRMLEGLKNNDLMLDYIGDLNNPR